MYEKYWELVEAPFQNALNTRFFYNSPHHEEALTRMLYCIDRDLGAAMVTGIWGSGKTLLVKMIQVKMPEKALQLIHR